MTLTKILLLLSLAVSPRNVVRPLPSLMDPQTEAALAQSAAPPSIAKDASIFLLRRGGYVRYRSGANGFTCFVVRTVPDELEPICYLDTEETHMLVAREFEEQRLREQGLSDTDVDTKIGELYRRGFLRPTQNFGLAYMLSPCNRVSDSQGEIVSEPPHMMFYAPYATNAQLGLAPPQKEKGHAAPFILFEGEPWASLIVRGEVADRSATRLCGEAK